MGTAFSFAVALCLIVSGLFGSFNFNSRSQLGTGSGLLAPGASNQTASWSFTWNNLLEGNCSGTAPAGTLYLYSVNEITKIGPSGQEWTVSLPSGYSLLPNPVDNPSCTVSALGNVYFYAGNLTRRSVFALNSEGALQWVYTPSGITLEGISSQTGTGGDIYVSGFAPCNCNQILLALNPEGVQLWNVTEPLSQYGLADSWLAPVLSPNGTIFVSILGYHSGTGMFALDPNGTTYWSYVFGSENSILGPVFAPNGDAYVWDGKALFSFAENGSIYWQTNLTANLMGEYPGGEFPGQIVINSNDSLLVNMEYPSTIVEFNSTDGAQIWNATLSSNLIYLSWLLGAAPGGTIFVQQFAYNNGVIMNGSSLLGYSANGSKVWSLPTNLLPPATIGGSDLPVDGSGDALVVSVNNTIYSVNSNGSSVWQAPLPEDLPVTGIDAGSPLYIWQSSSNESIIFAIDGQTYSPVLTTSILTLASTTTSQLTASSTTTFQTTSTQASNSTTAPIPVGGIDWSLIETGVLVGSVILVVVALVIALRRR
jgi:PQQ-like domain